MTPDGGRLRSLRLVGFKSFAERTLVEFGGGISAIVGPNGSGKSNLADALRWVLGEQGRTLRTRRAEDLIYAGSSSRRAQGMSDVTLVLDNADRLLPVDFGEVELGRRLFRNGENEFLLNRQRVRLRDLIDLLDEANLADNAFLFIGQGMVDQALALRPEERRPLFEEAAGIRKHERRRRAAEAELTQAELNLERVRDLVDELRPQARRLAAQAEQQRERRSAGAELATALVAAARDRLGGAERELGRQTAQLGQARGQADMALAQLRTAEEAVAAAERVLMERQELERQTRGELDAARAVTMDLRLAEQRSSASAEALGRDLERVRGEYATIAQRIDRTRQEMAIEVPELDHDAEEAVRDVARRVDDAERSMRELRDAGRAEAERTLRAREARAAQEQALERARRRAAAAAGSVTTQERRMGAATDAADTAGAALEEADAALAAALGTEQLAEQAFASSREAATEAEARAVDPVARLSTVRAELAAAEAHVASLERRIRSGQVAGIREGATSVADRMRTHGRRLDDGLDVDPELRVAVAAALGEALTATAMPSDAVTRVAAATDVGERAADTFVVDEAADGRVVRERDSAPVLAAAAALGGGSLVTAVRRDAIGHARRLLGRSVWVPTLDDALGLRSSLAPGWQVATPDGVLVTADGVVSLAPGRDALQVRAQHAEMAATVRSLSEAVVVAEADRVAADQAVRAARDAADRARQTLEPARAARRVAEERRRGASRTADSTTRERAWAETQLERARQEAAAADAELTTREAEATAWQDGGVAATGTDETRAAVAALEARIAALRTERDRHAVAATAARTRRETAEDQRRRAEVRVALDSTRLEELDLEVARLVGARSAQVDETAGHRSALAAASARADAIGVSLVALEGSTTDERARRHAAEEAGATAREGLRMAEARARAAEVAQLQVRLQLDAGREALLVELGGIGADGLRALRGESEDASVDDLAPDVLATELEAALDLAFEAWRPGDAAGPPVVAVSAARLGALRRRYHELGAGNPFAAQELGEVRERLDGLESQQSDLTAAIRDTRTLIARLDTLIAEQFRRTFTDLEGAFARRFQQLFGGGEAALSLTAPEDLGATGVEITARPPGKKRQPLAMLSGGERALTAVALLLAMLEVRPVPFCVLDEVDAALDEANVGRFASALQSLAETIQFIVITHNRGTIEAADALYGVTTGDDAVSHVVSLRLADLPSPDDAHADPAFAGAIR